MPDGHLPKVEFPHGAALSDDVCALCGNRELCASCALWERHDPNRKRHSLFRRWRPPLDPDPAPAVAIEPDSVYRHPGFFTVRCPQCAQSVNVTEEKDGWLTLAPHGRPGAMSSLPWLMHSNACSAGLCRFPVGGP
jgi:hypothetical protein